MAIKPAMGRIVETANKLAWVVLILVVPLVAFSARYTMTINTTPSLPIRLAIIEKGVFPSQVGQLVAFRSAGYATVPKGLVVVKKVMGMPGDIVRHIAPRDPAHQAIAVIENGAQVVEQPVRKVSRSFRLLPLGPVGRIPEMHYHVGGTHPDSLDSRYGYMGWVRADQVIGTVAWAW
jgi:conjugal transfer pilin signal peptidase TrbI